MENNDKENATEHAVLPDVCITKSGNAAAMREALTKVSEWMAHRIATGGFEASPTIPTVLEDVVLPALSAPARNCDVGTAEEWIRRHKNYCGNGRASFACINGPGSECKKCFAKWLKMPYNEGESDGSK